MKAKFQGRAEPAVLLRTRPLGEADLIAVLLTADGKREAVAASARRSRKRFVGGLAPGMRGVATLTPGKGTLMRLSSFEPTGDHTPVGRDLTRFAYVAYVCELTDELIGMDVHDPLVFGVVQATLAAIIEHPPQPAALRQFELRLLHALGFLPPLAACCVCRSRVLAGQQTTGVVGFDPLRGGVLCREHRGPGEVLVTSLLHAVALVEGDAAEVLEQVGEASASVRRGLRDLTFGFVRQHLRRPLKSLAFFAQLPRG